MYLTYFDVNNSQSLHMLSVKYKILCKYPCLIFIELLALSINVHICTFKYFTFFSERNLPYVYFRECCFEMHFLYKSRSFVSCPFSTVNVIWMHKSLAVHEMPTSTTKDMISIIMSRLANQYTSNPHQYRQKQDLAV